MNYRTLALAAILGASALPASAAGNYCGIPTGLEWDYRTATPQMMRILEGRHFTDDVELGVKSTSGSMNDIGADFDYTLKLVPNHARALNSVLRLASRYSNGVLPGSKQPIECYFERAVRIYPDDGVTWFMYARYQFLKGKDQQARSMLEKALEKSPEDPAINYNMGLVLAKLKKYDEALPYAQKAYALNFPMPALKQMLLKAGKWVEPPPLPAEGEAEPAAAAAAASAASTESAAPAAKPADPAPSTKP